MPAPARSARSYLVFVMLAALSLTAKAADTTPPAAPAAAAPAAPSPDAPAAPAPVPGAPTAAAVAAADKILGVIGVKQSMALVVPGMLTELETNILRSRPELRDSLRATLRAIQPEFDKTAQQTYDEAATILAAQMSEKEITDVAAFFESPPGKKYVEVMPVFLQKLSDVTTPWRDKLSTEIVERARQEMKKKGLDF